MNVQITHVEQKNITTREGKPMTLRVVQGIAESGSVFRHVLGRDHPNVLPGKYVMQAVPYIDFKCEVRSDIQLFPATATPATPAGK